ncbi:hypothetical protein MMC20_004665 [Loxospora ochrophaea]|nr:hypothetical protein [Loxospora ochrophaea]
MVEQSTQTFPFLKLPTEVRLMIYHLIVTHENDLRRWYYGDPPVDGCIAAILQTRRQISDEAAPIFYATNTFCFRQRPLLSSFKDVALDCPSINVPLRYVPYLERIILVRNQVWDGDLLRKAEHRTSYLAEVCVWLGANAAKRLRSLEIRVEDPSKAQCCECDREPMMEFRECLDMICSNIHASGLETGLSAILPALEYFTISDGQIVTLFAGELSPSSQDFNLDDALFFYRTVSNEAERSIMGAFNALDLLMRALEKSILFCCCAQVYFTNRYEHGHIDGK